MDKSNNPNCMLCGSPHCALLNEESCEKCRIGALPLDKQAEAAEDIFRIAEALPDEGVEPIMEAGECAFCRAKLARGGETGAETGADGAENGADGVDFRYAQMDMAHEHPDFAPDKQTDAKYDRSTSMIVPVQLPICDDCRGRLNLMYYLPMALGVLVALVGLVVTSLEPVRLPLTRAGRALPFLVFLIFVFLGVIVESIVKKILRDRVERSMTAREKRIASLADMLKKNWFTVGIRDGIPAFTFTADKLPGGIVTGPDQKKLIEQIRALGKEGIGLMKQKHENK